MAHFGGHDITCGVRLGDDPAAYAALRRDLLDRYARRSLSEVVRGFDAAFGRDTFSVTDLFLEERRRVLGALLGKVVARHESTVRHVWDETHALLDYLQSADVPIPETLARGGPSRPRAGRAGRPRRGRQRSWPSPRASSSCSPTPASSTSP